MKIQFSQSGGYAGLRMGCEIDTASLPPPEAERLTALVENSGILQATSQRTPHAADLFTYEFAIEARQGNHQVSFDDMSLPERVRPLLEYLQEQVHPLR
ncbi:MAG TPA: protealysin inhibitor emfourin [Allocoleopsis sp.]